ncbi:MAG: hypothetical protein ACE5ID_04475, partial [Acidobacteriota bacterium]
MAKESDPMSPGPSYTTTGLGKGHICPISEMLGQRRLRLIDASSAEGRRLLRSGKVMILAAPGVRFTGLPITSVLDRMAEDRQVKSQEPDQDPRAGESLRLVVGLLKQQSRAYS